MDKQCLPNKLINVEYRLLKLITIINKETDCIIIIGLL